MAKRGATSELNHNNWDDEEEPEEAGVFVQADKETLQNRVIKKAKRRGPAEDGGSKGAFSGFGGLTGGVSKANTFSGFGSSGKSTFGSFQSFKATPASGESGKLFFGASSTPVSSSNGSKEQTTASPSSKSGAVKSKGSGDWKDSSEYFNFLKSLNLSVLAWIKKHVEENPYIILSPIFKDYEQYLQEQEKEASSVQGDGLLAPAKKDAGPIKDSEDATLPAQSDSNKESSTSDSEADVQKPASAFSGAGTKPLTGFTFGTTSTAPLTFGESSKSAPSKTASPFEKSGVSPVVETTTTTSASATSSSGFTFGLSSSPASTKPGFSFGMSSTTTGTTGFSFGTSSSSAPGTTGFSFGTSSSSASGMTGFSFGATASQAVTSGAGSSNGTNADDDDYVPPKPEVREIKEDDALYSKRCKLYFQRNDQWVDKGVGNLHLKPVAENKTQLLVRADTNLGNILLNVMLSQSLPVSRQGKNNVLIVCVPNPPLDSKTAEDDQNKPVPMLIRVKTGEDADELFGKINERKELL